MTWTVQWNLRKEKATFKMSKHQMESYLEEMSQRRLLRVSTAGSVDDGKSTLIGRLLYDTGALFTDQVESLVTKQSASPDFSRITDGLLAEREQKITIDV